MNAVEIEEAVEQLVAQPFDRAEFPFQFLTAFGNKDTTVQRLRSGSSNNSDVAGGVLQRNNIHIATCAAGAVEETLAALRSSPRTEAQKAKFILVTDGDVVQAEDLTSSEPLACDYARLHERFGFFLPLAGISTVSEIKNNPIDIKATGRLNKLYVELLSDNPEWGSPDRRPALNQFMARLIFCFFAEDTGIFQDGLFTATVAQMSHAGHGSGAERWGNTHEVLSELFRAMDTDIRHEGRLDDRHRRAAGVKSWADVFPYVNGGLFAGNVECPKFSRIARSYLLRAGELNWREINPDIFGSMIQAVADEDERGELGMHYTSVPNILKVLNPLFLDDLREHLVLADDNARKLRNLRKRIANIRVFDPACGSGNFLVIAYLKMREIEDKIVRRTGDEPRSVIKLSNFYGIEIKSFAVEIARLSLLIAEFQADCRYISQQEARAMVLPLHRTGQIHTGNALSLNWLEICSVDDSQAQVEHDLAGPTGRLALVEDRLGEQNAAEIYVCGNPPYLGSTWQSREHKADLEGLFAGRIASWGTLDYVSGWFLKASDFAARTSALCAFVSTNSICQGQQVALLWPVLFRTGCEIAFAYTSFKWANLASYNAGVTVVIVGLGHPAGRRKFIFEPGEDGATNAREVSHINAYLTPGADTIVEKRSKPLAELPSMSFGNKPVDGGNLILSPQEAADLPLSPGQRQLFLRRNLGSAEFIQGHERFCLWIEDGHLEEALAIAPIAARIERVRDLRLASSDPGANAMAECAHQFREMRNGTEHTIAIAAISSENRPYLPAGLLGPETTINNKMYAIYDGPLWSLALLVSRLHWVWIGTVCVRLEMRFSYSNTLGWNTFPVPKLTERDKLDLSRCAQDILLAREAHFPATIADLYDPDKMPDDLRRAHEANDETIERIYIGRRFRNDTERLERLFELYSRMAADQPKGKKVKRVA